MNKSLLIASLVAALSLSACGKKEEPAAAAPVAQPAGMAGMEAAKPAEQAGMAGMEAKPAEQAGMAGMEAKK